MEKDRLIHTINRFDHFYDSVNNKGNIVLGLCTFISGGVVAGYQPLTQVAKFTIPLHALLISIIILGFTAILMLVIAAIPHLTKSNGSLLYFRSISRLTLSQFAQKSKERGNDKELEDLREQVHALACGLDRKFRRLKTAMILITIQLLLLTPTFLFIFFNLK